jgi:type IV pilus assembly protein PilB
MAVTGVSAAPVLRRDCVKANEVRLTSLIQHLIKKNILTPESASEALEIVRQQGLSFISYLTKNSLADNQVILQSCAELFALPLFDARDYKNFLNLAPILTPALCRRYRAIPLAKKDSTLHLGISDPTDQSALEMIMFHSGLRIYPVLLTEPDLDELIEKYFRLYAAPQLELSLLKQLPIDDEPQNVKEHPAHYEEPLIKFVDNVIRHALQKSASDIHIEPYANDCRIRYRQDGILYQIAAIPAHFAARLSARLKVMAGMDIAERRLPQDGRFQMDADRTQSVDIRMNTCPTVYGEKVVLRILDGRISGQEINMLGFTPMQKKIFLKNISRPQGLILVAGPTGSGKTVTLYSALRYLNSAEKNISTIENPVEIHLPGINQVNINPKIGLHFATALRTILRQDPDIIMVGEIRDVETAEIAIQAAQTGHLVLSTIHTNSAIETFMRLQTMGIETYNLTHSLTLIVSQRLARKLCPHCKIAENNPSQDFISYEAVGCNQCLYGYQGRIGIYELLPFTDNIKNLFLSHSPPGVIYQHLHQENFLSLAACGMLKVKEGITSYSEINRIITP